MDLNIKYNSENDCIMIHLKGEFNKSFIGEYVDKIEKMIKKHNCTKILTDARKINTKVSMGDIYYFPQLLNKYKHLLTCKRAIIKSKKSEDLDFFELVSINNGHQVKLFSNPEKAMNWLNE